VIYKLRELRGVEELGGTMRLGAWPCKIEPGTLAYQVYGKTEISERHRHRYEFNREYETTLVAGGLRISGSTPDGTYVEMVEIPEHPYFIGCQFHPEFKSKPLEPHPLFKAFIGAAHERGLKRRSAKESGRSRNVPPAGEGRKAIAALSPGTSRSRAGAGFRFRRENFGAVKVPVAIGDGSKIPPWRSAFNSITCGSDRGRCS